MSGPQESNSTEQRVFDALGALEGDRPRDIDLGAPLPPPPDEARLTRIQRPNGSYYYPRSMVGNRTDVETLIECRAAGIPVLLSGYPGCGKTALVEAAFGESLVTIAGHGDTEDGDLIGSYSQTPDGNYIWNDGPLIIAMKQGRPLFIDDCTLIPPGVLARLYPAMDGRNRIVVTEHQGEIIDAVPGFYVSGAHNPDAPGSVLSEALSSRFSMQIHVTTSLKMAEKMGIHRTALQVAAKLRKLRERSGGWAPEMRELLTFQKVFETFGLHMAVSNMIASAPEDEQPILLEEFHSRLSFEFEGLNIDNDAQIGS